jgi:hypothetical protein
LRSDADFIIAVASVGSAGTLVALALLELRLFAAAEELAVAAFELKLTALVPGPAENVSEFVAALALGAYTFTVVSRERATLELGPLPDE